MKQPRSLQMVLCLTTGADVYYPLSFLGSEMKIKFTLSCGTLHKKEDVIEYDDDILNDMDLEATQKWLDKEWQEWAWQYIDGGVEIVEE